MDSRRDAVTGAFGFTGRAIAVQLLDAGRDVVTLARRVDRADPIAPRLAIHPLDFTGERAGAQLPDRRGCPKLVAIVRPSTRRRGSRPLAIHGRVTLRRYRRLEVAAKARSQLGDRRVVA